MPPITAFVLKTFALNRDSGFAQFHITYLRIIGDKHYINISLGVFDKTSIKRQGSNINSVFGFFLGKYLIPIIMMAIGIGLTLWNPFAPPPASELPITDTVQPSATITSPTITLTPTQTNTPEPEFEVMNAVVTQHLSCLHGPGEFFLYRYGMIEGINLTVYGKDIHSGWAYVEADDYEGKCWVLLSQITLEGDASNLKVLYPGEVGLPLSFLWPVPQNVYTVRTADGTKVAIYWDEYSLPDGEMESPDSPRYLLELWTCQGGQLNFESKFVWDDDIVVIDEKGCDEPSHAAIYLVEKHGYAGPVEISWP
jgi:hypothetical protein